MAEQPPVGLSWFATCKVLLNSRLRVPFSVSIQCLATQFVLGNLRPRSLPPGEVEWVPSGTRPPSAMRPARHRRGVTPGRAAVRLRPVEPISANARWIARAAPLEPNLWERRGDGLGSSVGGGVGQVPGCQRLERQGEYLLGCLWLLTVQF